MNRMFFLSVCGLIVVAGVIGGKAEAAGEMNKIRGKNYVAACPPVTPKIPRTPGPYRIMVIGAHPDDADIVCGCTAIMLIAKGCQVKFVSVTDGSVGHHVHDRKTTAKIRRQETQSAAMVLGLVGYDIYGFEDGRCPNSVAARELVGRRIQEFEPDIVITHRDCDYHADHRATGALVKDCGYMLGCPHWVEGSKALRRRPLILLMRDDFTVPRVMKPDILVDCDPYIEKWCDALDCQVSQFYEWLPWDKGTEDEVAAIGDRTKNIAGRNVYLKKYWAAKKDRDAVRFADVWREQYPGKSVPKMLEAYEISEYGRPPTEEDFELLMGD